MKKYLVISVLGLILTIGLYTAYQLYAKHPESTHYHAGFTVFVNGQKQDFSGYQYMNFTPCTEHDSPKSHEDEQIEKAHLHDSVGDVVHVHRPGAVWSDLFRNINFAIPGEIVGYVNGQKVTDIVQSPILADESVIFVIGDPAQADLNAYVSLDHIRKIEAKSELCGQD